MPADTIANKYRILREIARSNDVVYEATDTTTGRRVALKELVLPANLTPPARRDRIERFNREARAAGRLSHQNIVSVYDFGESGGRYYIAMEYLEGQTLREALQAHGSLPISESVEIACQVLAALGHAHSHRVIHRDVKPDNISILPGGLVKLTDFGIARLTEEASLTGDGQVFGTPSYMSPEQIEGGNIDYRTDIFSMGIVLYEMLAGRKPFTGDSVVSITYSIMHHEPPPLDGIPVGLERVVMRALSKDPLGRPKSAAEMSQELQTADLRGPLDQPAMMTGMGYFGGGAPPGPGAYGGAPSPPPVYAPSPWIAQPAPVRQPAYGAPSAAPAAGPPLAGPFATWGAGGQAMAPTGAPPPPVPPAVVRPRRGVGQGTRSFFAALVWGMSIAAVVVGFILLFVRAFDEHQVQSANLRVQQLMADGTSLFKSGKLQEAADQFSQAVKEGGNSRAARDARTSLAVVYNQQGKEAYLGRQYAAAERAWYAALDVLAGVQTTEDEQRLIADVNHNLNALYDRTNGAEGAPREGLGGRVGYSDPNAPGDTANLDTRVARGQDELRAGMDLYNRGDISGAKEQWQKAVEDAPGTPAAMDAQRLLDQTTTPPQF